MWKVLGVALVLSATLLENVDAFGKHGHIARDHYARHEKKDRTHEHGSQKRDTSSFRFLNNATAPFQVQSLPDVPYDVGELYSGNIPIDYSNTSETLFFMFQPTVGAPVDEITIWLNGGPGCSSLIGFFQENGLFVWQPGTYQPTVNPYSWVNLTNMLWVEQPVGTGFATGTPKATTEEETAQDFIKFFKNFEVLFGITNFKIYVSGESYAGRYVPYISAAMLNQNDTTYYNLSGALVYDPCIGQFDYTQEEVVTVPFIQENANLFNFNDTFMQYLEQQHQSCGYADLINQYLTFPPPGNQPAKFFNYTSEADCDVFDTAFYAALTINPCFNIYEINQQCPLLWDIFGFPTAVTDVQGNSTVYFNRTDVKAAIHAPQDVDWTVCSNEAVFVGGDGGPEGEGDLSADPIQHVLPQVIEATNRVLVANGDFDMIIITNGTLLAIQNMTWNGQLGFQTAPSTPINVTLEDLQYEALFNDSDNAAGFGGADGPQGIMGVQHYERGLLWASSALTGHMQPQFQPRLAYRHLQWLLGRIDTL